MSTSPKIESADLSIEQMYKDFYIVPPYQREYVWPDVDVQAFADDIYNEFYGAKGELVAHREYFIGSVVVCRTAHGPYDLIDGQQRMTTIFLFLCAIRDALLTLGEAPSKSLEAMICDTRTGDDGNDVQDYRLLLQYEDSRDVLIRIAQGESLTSSRDDTRSMVCIIEAYETLRSFLTAQFDDSSDEIKQFFVAFIRRVKLIRIVTPDLTHALKVFETVNDRGVGLTAMDLLKNLLFMRTTPADYPKLQSLWKELTLHLEMCREKPLRFLRYYVMANYKEYRSASTGKPVREDELYEWFGKHAEEIGIDAKPLDFAKDLVLAARDYRQFAGGRTPDGKTAIPGLQNIQHLSGKARQHFILMLASRHLPADGLVELARQLENLFFVFVIVREPTKNFETKFADWSESLRTANSLEDVKRIINSRIAPEVEGKSRAFDFAMNELGATTVPKYRLKYVLAKLAQHVDHIAWQGAQSVQQLDHYLDGKIEIEHVLPQKAELGAWGGFNDPEVTGSCVQRLGNLTLLEKPLNAAVCNACFDKKLEAYRDSKIVITRVIGNPNLFGKNTSLQRAIGLVTTATSASECPTLGTPSAWSAERIEARQEGMAKLARAVWMVDQLCEKARA
ncbi:TPA: DUF262 domain-containing protein [Stenotrophomonas maltophilia]|nr:DUF262 domain-containing protein [Stenotrophomonas maltophilia]